MQRIDMRKMGERISARRGALGLTQQAVYEKLGISANHYSRIENGHAGISLEVLAGLCDVLSVSADHILTGDCASAGAAADFSEKYASLTSKQKKFILGQMDAIRELNLK